MQIFSKLSHSVTAQRSRVGFVLLLVVLALSGWAQESSDTVSAHSINSLAAIAPAPVSLADEAPVVMFTPRNGRWVNTLLKQVPAGGEFISADQLYRKSDVCTFLLPDIDVNKLTDADGAYNPQNYRWPTAFDVVMVLDAQMKFTHHAVLGTLQPYIRVCFQGKAYDLRAGRMASTMDLADTGIVSSRVTQTFKRKADTLIDLKIRTADGKETVISGTPEHPFFVSAVNNYVTMRKLASGTVLKTEDDSLVTVAASNLKHSNFDVYNLEIAGQHNYFVTSKDGEPGVLVHNGCDQWHHPWPKYLGGPAKQKLLQLETKIHELYHGGLDGIFDSDLARQKSKAYFDGLSEEAKDENLNKLIAYTEYFDKENGTSILPALLKELGFQ